MPKLRGSHFCRKHRWMSGVATLLCVVFFFTCGCGRKAAPPRPAAPADAALPPPQAGEEAGGDVAAPREAADAAPTAVVEEPAAAPPDAAPADATATAQAGESEGRQLYLRHCAACHGERGDGLGLAAAYVFPKPRDFRAGRFRLVSTRNNVPTRADLMAVLDRGMPGSSMPPWAHLPDAQRQLLVDEIMRLRRAGAHDQYVRVLKEEDELTDEEIATADLQAEIGEFVERFSTPGASVEVPEITPPGDEAVVRGKEIYFKQSCHSCHGNEGKGDGVQKMVDDEKLPTAPRDFTLGIFKGGHDAASLYRRIAYGMPGTPMPASTQLSPQQMVDLVHFVRSLSSEEQRLAAIMNRAKIVARAVETLPESADTAAWSAASPVSLRTTPLWWREQPDPDLQIQALHDGQTIALRISWRDASRDADAARSESFEDAVAVELFRGEDEPFLGMGDARSAVDVWFWDADRQGTPLAVEDVYPRTVVDQFPFSEAAVASAELDRPGARQDDQPDVSLPARASGNPIVPRGGPSGATSLAAGGPGSVTFRIPSSQLVTAVGHWQDGRWTVLMTRPLAVPSPQQGVPLEAGAQASLAVAVWDGAQQDRDGKKRITIWQDLQLE